MFKIGDRVLFTWQTKGQGGNTSELKTNIGIVIGDNKDTTYTILHYRGNYNFSTTKSIKEENMCLISEREQVVNEIKSRYEKLLLEQRSKLKTVTQEEKDKEKLELYQGIRRRIIINAERMLKNLDDEEEFVNRLKEITSLKTQLFKNELECISEIRRYNGTIKWEYKQLEGEMNKLINGISDEAIARIFDFE